MQIFQFQIEPEAVAKGRQDGQRFLKVENACPCGCAPKPFITISDGQVGLTVRFENEAEIEQFKAQVRVLAMPYSSNCRYCEHLKAVNAPREEYVGMCELKLSPDTCGKFELSQLYERQPDPRHIRK